MCEQDDFINNMAFIHIIANQEPNLNDRLLNEFRQLQESIAYIATWIDDFHNEEVYENGQEKELLLSTFRKIRRIMEEEIQ
jgi:hypothetical protein